MVRPVGPMLLSVLLPEVVLMSIIQAAAMSHVVDLDL